MRLTHKNKVAEHLIQSRFGFDRFELFDNLNVNEPELTIIEFKNSKFVFHIEPFSSDYNAYSVGYTQYGPSYRLHNPSPKSTLTIDQVIAHIDYWLDHEVQPFVADQAAVDLWEEYKSGVEYLRIDEIETTDLTHFSNDDIVRIRFAIEDLKALIPQRFKVTEDQMAMIVNKLDYLASAANRVPKTDWKGIAISIIAGIIIALSLDTARGSQLWELFMQVFKTILLLPTGSD
ncbi:hypothetical protein [Puia dinghuensis]|uniref:Uncharacterized protein n=1 Tax=Puia dinghuensis TaxID=1792502 RepID=A0A8J2UGJ6_9BACT|nr:hypothetical protein [Puia dinghuensis]GGB14507.1 hypothetical protein GCM10011511_42940 [Puia dinghuensis]